MPMQGFKAVGDNDNLLTLDVERRRALLAMPPADAFDAWPVARSLSILHALERHGLLRRGNRGWMDARLTLEGRRAHAYFTALAPKRPHAA